VGKFATFSERPKAKSVSASLPSHQGLCPGPHWGLQPRPLIIGA